MENVTIKFKNGQTIEAENNGSCFITNTKPNFPADLSEVTIIYSDHQETISYAIAQEAASIDNRYWFTFVTATAYEKLESQVLYTAMMTDTLID